MFQRILIPLDGSARAEDALPIALRLARAARGTLVLVQIVHAPSEVGDYGAEPEAMAVPPTSHEKRVAEAEHYLQQLLDTHQSELAGVSVEREVETGAPAGTICSVARQEHVDLIVMCSHGAHSLLHWMFRSIAREALHCSPVPVLVLKDRGGSALQVPEGRRLRVLVPLDGSRLAESALPPALQLLSALVAPDAAELHLLRVIDLPSIEDKPLQRAYDIQNAEEQAVKEAESYLRQVEQRLVQSIPAGARPGVSWSFVVSNHVGRTLAEMAQLPTAGRPELAYDVVVMATHGRTGFQRLRMGSVTEYVLRASELPLLIVRPPQSAGPDAAQKEPEVALGA